ncbi:DinB family protein [Ectobacillus sp. JY-23]|uniref:DinB family protein n=1 Tax=Ectobacillus sp. JY-23 TaxID=2933872 RepID=UPI001FF2692B|nr:DinB family protein [Ectobacillus sp. JY-23]UOY92520.1 DinB family protein [Ectobacillus sp. JY-23]
MHAKELILLNFEEVRRRSIKVWSALPAESLHWRPDDNAFTCADLIRHVLEGEYLYHQILLNKGSIAKTNPFEARAFLSVEDELAFARPYREGFLHYITTLHPDDLHTVEIDRSNVGYIRTLGDMLLRVAYHESIHTGQLLGYMRTIGVERPNIWD